MDLNGTAPATWWYSILPLVIVGVAVVGFICLMLLVVLTGRRVTMNVKTGGAVALTLASILLLSGLWCMFISPTVTYNETREGFYRDISIQGLESWTYSFNAQEGDDLMVSVDGVQPYNATEVRLNVYIYGPDGETVWSETNIKYTHFTIKASRTGLHRVEVENPNPEDIRCYLQITVSLKATYRPLEPFGEWISLVSLPVFGLGAWASGLLSSLKRKTAEPSEK